MKTYMHGQAKFIETWGEDYARHVYDKFRHGTYFRWEDVAFPGFVGRAESTQRAINATLLHWMAETAPDCIQKRGHKWFIPE